MWMHPKVKGKFKGHYRLHRGERVFDLVSDARTITFESWQMAKKLGWMKVKDGAERAS